MTVRPRPSITRVAGPRRRRISSFLPVAVTFPSEIAIASTNEGTLFVAILALCKMISADTRISFFVFHALRKGGSKLPPLCFTCALRQGLELHIRQTSLLANHAPWCRHTRPRCRRLRDGSSQCP